MFTRGMLDESTPRVVLRPHTAPETEEDKQKQYFGTFTARVAAMNQSTGIYDPHSGSALQPPPESSPDATEASGHMPSQRSSDEARSIPLPGFVKRVEERTSCPGLAHGPGVEHAQKVGTDSLFASRAVLQVVPVPRIRLIQVSVRVRDFLDSGVAFEHALICAHLCNLPTEGHFISTFSKSAEHHHQHLMNDRGFAAAANVGLPDLAIEARQGQFVFVEVGATAYSRKLPGARSGKNVIYINWMDETIEMSPSATSATLDVAKWIEGKLLGAKLDHCARAGLRETTWGNALAYYVHDKESNMAIHVDSECVDLPGWYSAEESRKRMEQFYENRMCEEYKTSRDPEMVRERFEFNRQHMDAAEPDKPTGPLYDNHCLSILAGMVHARRGFDMSRAEGINRVRMLTRMGIAVECLLTSAPYAMSCNFTRLRDLIAERGIESIAYSAITQPPEDWAPEKHIDSWFIDDDEGSIVPSQSMTSSGDVIWAPHWQGHSEVVRSEGFSNRMRRQLIEEIPKFRGIVEVGNATLYVASVLQRLPRQAPIQKGNLFARGGFAPKDQPGDIEQDRRSAALAARASSGLHLAVPAIVTVRTTPLALPPTAVPRRHTKEIVLDSEGFTEETVTKVPWPAGLLGGRGIDPFHSKHLTYDCPDMTGAVPRARTRMVDSSNVVIHNSFTLCTLLTAIARDMQAQGASRVTRKPYADTLNEICSSYGLPLEATQQEKEKRIRKHRMIGSDGVERVADPQILHLHRRTTPREDIEIIHLTEALRKLQAEERIYTTEIAYTANGLQTFFQEKKGVARTVKKFTPPDPASLQESWQRWCPDDPYGDKYFRAQISCNAAMAQAVTRLSSIPTAGDLGALIQAQNFIAYRHPRRFEDIRNDDPILLIMTMVWWETVPWDVGNDPHVPIGEQVHARDGSILCGAKQNGDGTSRIFWLCLRKTFNRNQVHSVVARPAKDLLILGTLPLWPTENRLVWMLFLSAAVNPRRFSQHLVELASHAIRAMGRMTSEAGLFSKTASCRPTPFGACVVSASVCIIRMACQPTGLRAVLAMFALKAAGPNKGTLPKRTGNRQAIMKFIDNELMVLFRDRFHVEINQQYLPQTRVMRYAAEPQS